MATLFGHSAVLPVSCHKEQSFDFLLFGLNGLAGVGASLDVPSHLLDPLSERGRPSLTHSRGMRWQEFPKVCAFFCEFNNYMLQTGRGPYFQCKDSVNSTLPVSKSDLLTLSNDLSVLTQSTFVGAFWNWKASAFDSVGL